MLPNLQSVLAIELLTAAQGVEFHKPLKCGEGTGAAYREIRKVIPPLEEDRVLYDDVQKVLELVNNDVLLNAVEKKVDLK